jgi:ribosome recycling factor
MLHAMRRVSLISSGRGRLLSPSFSSFCLDLLMEQESWHPAPERGHFWRRPSHVKQAFHSITQSNKRASAWAGLVYVNRQCRWKHNRAARRGNHLEKLDDLAHSNRRQEAAERKSRKRDKSRGDGAADDDDDDSEKKNAIKSEGLDSSDAEPRLPDVATVRKEMEQIFQLFLESLKGIRGAEPTPDLFDRIMVNAYGSQVPLSTVAQVVIVNPTLATATCFDPSLAKSVAVAIRDKLELNPAVDEDDSVRIPVPRPTLESRRKLSQQVHERGEACRKRIRNVRRSAMDVIKQGMVGKLEGISKDEAFRASHTLESATDEIVKKVTAAEKDKQQSIMDV